jgi:hypothetical protein
MKTLLPIACVLIPFTVACGGSDGSGTSNDVGASGEGGAGGAGAAPECDPNADIPCVEGIAEPCDLDSGWLGDEYCLAVPDATEGLQLHVGPTEYDNPDDTDAYVIKPGEELNWAEITETSNTEELFLNGYYSFMRPGSHHFILYGLPEGTYDKGTQNTGSGAESAVGALDGEFLAGATKAIQGAILDDGDPTRQLGNSMAPGQDVAVNLHFINTTDQPLIQEIWVNFKLIAEEDIRRWTKPVTWYGGLGMNIPPGTQETVRNPDASCVPPPNTPDMEFTVLTGHVHANTVRYNAIVKRAGSTEEELLFEDYDWHDPTQFMYLQNVENTPPDPSSKTAGAMSGIIPIQQGDEYYWECEVHNEHTDIYLTFANSVYDGEMCNVFGFYSSPDRNLGNWGCFSF